MRNLLSADFRRLFKSRTFLIFIICVVGFSAFICMVNTGEYGDFTKTFYTFYPFAGFFAAAIISLFIGQDYSDGTIRNKLIVGHSRLEVYLSNLITSSAIAVIMMVTHLAITYPLGLMLFHFTDVNFADILYHAFLCTLAVMALSALFTAMSMNIPNKAVCVIILFALVLAFTFLQSFVSSSLSEPETTREYVSISEEGIEWGPEIPNPAYVSNPTQRQIYEIINDMPTGQLASTQNLDFRSINYWWLASIVYYAVTSLAGLVLFRRKDLK